MEMRLLTTENERNVFARRLADARAQARASFRDGGATPASNLVRLRSADFYALFENDDEDAEQMTAGVVLYDLEAFPQSCREPDLSQFAPRSVLECSDHWSLSRGAGMRAWRGISVQVSSTLSASGTGLSGSRGSHSGFYAAMGFVNVGDPVEYPFLEVPGQGAPWVQPMILTGEALARLTSNVHRLKIETLAPVSDDPIRQFGIGCGRWRIAMRADSARWLRARLNSAFDDRGIGHNTHFESPPTSRGSAQHEEKSMNIDPTRDRDAQARPSDDFAGNVPVKLTERGASGVNCRSCLPSEVVFSRRRMDADTDRCLVLPTPLQSRALPVDGGVHRSSAACAAILMHDGVHYRLFRGRRLNDWTAEGRPCMAESDFGAIVPQEPFRASSVSQHGAGFRFGAPPGDFELGFPDAPGRLTWLMLRDLSGLGGIYFLMLVRTLLSKDAGVSRGFLIVRYGFYAAAIASFAWFGALHLLLMYWIVPLFTWFIVIFRIRSIAEHSRYRGPYQRLRATQSTARPCSSTSSLRRRTSTTTLSITSTRVFPSTVCRSSIAC